MQPLVLSQAKLDLRTGLLEKWRGGVAKDCGTLIIYLNAYNRNGAADRPCLIRRPEGDPKYLRSKGVNLTHQLYWAPPSDSDILIVTEGVFDALAVRHWLGHNAVAVLTNRVSASQAEQIAQYHKGQVWLGLDNDEPGYHGAVVSYGFLKAAGCGVTTWVQWAEKDPEETYLLGRSFMKRPVESLLHRYATCDMLYDIAWSTKEKEDIIRWHRKASKQTA